MDIDVAKVSNPEIPKLQPHRERPSPEVRARSWCLTLLQSKLIRRKEYPRRDRKDRIA